MSVAMRVQNRDTLATGPAARPDFDIVDMPGLL
jgi:hypothetical protein